MLVHGPRQCGKTTLGRLVGERKGYAYISFDNDVSLAAARADPVGFVDDLPLRTVLDEVQRAPELFTALKTTVDRERAPGRFILTGSAKCSWCPSCPIRLRGEWKSRVCVRWRSAKSPGDARPAA